MELLSALIAVILFLLPGPAREFVNSTALSGLETAVLVGSALEPFESLVVHEFIPPGAPTEQAFALIEESALEEEESNGQQFLAILTQIEPLLLERMYQASNLLSSNPAVWYSPACLAHFRC